MKYKMIVADFDDTLLNSQRTYSQRIKNIIKKYVDKGGKFVIATGRMTAAVLPYCRDLGLKGEVITYQGGVIADIESGEILEQTHISYLAAYKLALHIEEMGYYYHVYCGDTFIVKNATPQSVRYANLCNVDYVELNYDISKFIFDNKICPVKMMIITEEDNVMPLIKKLSAKYSDTFLFNTSKKWMVEMVPVLVNKGFAVAQLAKKYGIKREEIICIGDSLNDLSMIEYAGLGAVVANGSAEAKAAADIIAPSNDDEGVAYIIEKYGFLE